MQIKKLRLSFLLKIANFSNQTNFLVFFIFQASFWLSPHTASANTPPKILEKIDLKVIEDSADRTIVLDQYFKDDEQNSASLTYGIVNNSNINLFAKIEIHNNRLKIEFNKDRNGLAQITVRATDNFGLYVDGVLNVTVVPVNDTPICSTLPNLDLSIKNNASINLYDYFTDVEDASNLLTYKIKLSRNDAVDVSSINLTNGQVTFTKKPGAIGTVKVTIRATDRDGDWVERTIAPDDFKVYGLFAGTRGVDYPDYTTFGVEDLLLLTNWFYLTYLPESNSYDTTKINEARWRQSLRNSVPRNNLPLPMNVEIEPYFGNNPQGRDNLARLMQIAKEERPDLNTLGFYRLLPERNWGTPVNYSRQKYNLSVGIEDWYTTEPQLSGFQTDYSLWLSRNLEYSTRNVSNNSGGGTVASKVGYVFPSLYTFHRNNLGYKRYQEVSFNSDQDTVYSQSFAYTNGAIIRFLKVKNAILPKGVSLWTDYEVVNSTFISNGSSFRLKNLTTGQLVDFSDNGAGKAFISSNGPWFNLWEDGAVNDWKIYAEENIKEARKYNKKIYVFLAPSFNGTGNLYLEKDFFLHQMDLLYKFKVDGIIIWQPTKNNKEFYLGQSWWSEINQFMTALSAPLTEFSINLGDNPEPQPPSNLRIN